MRKSVFSSKVKTFAALKTQMNNLLASDHSELDELLNKLFSAFETGDIEQIYKRLDIFRARLAMHIRAEHLHLFPAIIGAFEAQKQSNNISPLTIAQSTITQLQEDHNFFMRELVSAIKQMRDLRENNQTDESSRFLIVRERIIAVSRRLEAHNELEESQVYPWADTMLEPVERIDLNGKMQKELDNLPPRFRSFE